MSLGAARQLECAEMDGHNQVPVNMALRYQTLASLWLPSSVTKYLWHHRA